MSPPALHLLRPGTLGPHRPEPGRPAPLPLSVQLPRGRLVELTGDRRGAHLTSAVACLRNAQLQGQTTAWVQPAGGALFPPDLADSGIDLDALLVVQVPPGAGTHGVPRAAELLLRSGGFGCVVLDLTRVFEAEPHPGSPRPSHRHGGRRTPQGRRRHWATDTAWQGRLLSLAREHDAWLLLLTARPGRDHAGRDHHSSLGPLVSLCLSPTRTRTAPGHFEVWPEVWKDKSGSLQRDLLPELRRGPWGLL